MEEAGPEGEIVTERSEAPDRPFSADNPPVCMPGTDDTPDAGRGAAATQDAKTVTAITAETATSNQGERRRSLRMRQTQRTRAPDAKFSRRFGYFNLREHGSSLHRFEFLRSPKSRRWSCLVAKRPEGGASLFDVIPPLQAVEGGWTNVRNSFREQCTCH